MTGLAIKIIAGLGLLIVAMLAWERYETVTQERDQLQKDLAAKTSQLEAAQKLAADEQSAREKLNKTNQEIKREAEELRECIADGSCVATVSVRVESACVPSNDGATRVEYRQAELAPVAARARTRLEEELKELEALYSFCQATLRSWAASSQTEG